MFITDVTSESLTTAEPAHLTWPTYWGFVAIAVASILFGSNLIPVKKFESGDGLFFQWVCCIAIWMTGFVLNGIRLFPQFYPLAMLGGFLWCTGNVMVVPILKMVGLSQGILIWASVNMLSGWAVSRFGWLGLNKDVPPHIIMNYIGVVLCLISAVTYMFIRTTNAPSSSSSAARAVEDPLLAVVDASPSSPAAATADAAAAINGDAVARTSLHAAHPPVFYERMSPAPRRLLGIAMAVAAGLLFGLNFCPVIYIQQHPLQYPTASINGMDYVFAHFTGILVTSTVYMLIYCVAMKNKPRIYPELILPGFLAGVMWGIADIGWFIANDLLSQPISFPIITSTPALIGAFWGIVLFHEIQGRRNYIVLMLAVCFALSGSVLTGLSKWEKWNRPVDHTSTTATATITTATTTTAVTAFTTT